MVNRILYGNMLMILSLVPIGFLIYTLASLEELKITLSHPRVAIELSIFLILLSTGFLLSHIELKREVH
jgi:hypothetical protein